MVRSAHSAGGCKSLQIFAVDPIQNPGVLNAQQRGAICKGGANYGQGGSVEEAKGLLPCCGQSCWQYLRRGQSLRWSPHSDSMLPCLQSVRRTKLQTHDQR
jgi:hypothetical protein